jgi:hypothetical protein
MIGIAFGPYGADLFNPRAWGGGEDYDDVLLEVTRVVIALSVFACVRSMITLEVSAHQPIASASNCLARMFSSIGVLSPSSSVPPCWAAG